MKRSNQMTTRSSGSKSGRKITENDNSNSSDPSKSPILVARKRIRAGSKNRQVANKSQISDSDDSIERPRASLNNDTETEQARIRENRRQNPEAAFKRHATVGALPAGFQNQARTVSESDSEDSIPKPSESFNYDTETQRAILKEKKKKEVRKETRSRAARNRPISESDTDVSLYRPRESFGYDTDTQQERIRKKKKEEEKRQKQDILVPPQPFPQIRTRARTASTASTIAIPEAPAEIETTERSDHPGIQLNPSSADKRKVVATVAPENPASVPQQSTKDNETTEHFLRPRLPRATSSRVNPLPQAFNSKETTPEESIREFQTSTPVSHIVANKNRSLFNDATLTPVSSQENVARKHLFVTAKKPVNKANSAQGTNQPLSPERNAAETDEPEIPPVSSASTSNATESWNFKKQKKRRRSGICMPRTSTQPRIKSLDSSSSKPLPKNVQNIKSHVDTVVSSPGTPENDNNVKELETRKPIRKRKASQNPLSGSQSSNANVNGIYGSFFENQNSNGSSMFGTSSYRISSQPETRQRRGYEFQPKKRTSYSQPPKKTVEPQPNKQTLQPQPNEQTLRVQPNKQTVEAEADEQNSEAKADEQNSEAQADEQSEAQADEQNSEAQADEQNSEAQADEQNSEAKADQQSEAEADKQSEDQADQQSEAQVDQQSEAQADQQSEAQADQQSEAQADQQSEAEADEQSEAEADEHSEAEADEHSEAEADEQSEAEADDTDEQSEAQADDQSEAQADEQSEAQANEQSEAQADDQSEAQADEQSEAQANEQSEAQADEQSEAQADDQSEAQADEQSETLGDELSEAQADELSEAQADELSEAQADELSEAQADELSEAQADELSEAQADGPNEQTSEAQAGKSLSKIQPRASTSATASRRQNLGSSYSKRNVQPRRKVTRKDSWGPYCRRLQGGKLTPIFLNKDKLSKEVLKELVDKFVKTQKLSKSQMDTLHGEINSFLEKFFDSLSDNTPLAYGVFTFQDLLEAMEKEKLMLPSDASTPKDLIKLMKKSSSLEEFEKAETYLYPPKNGRTNDTLNFFDLA